MAQLDACPTGDHEVVGSTPTRSATFFHGDLIMKYFVWSFFPFRWFKKGSCQFLVEECAQHKPKHKVYKMDWSKTVSHKAVSNTLLDYVLTKGLLVCIVFQFGENFKVDS